MKPPAHLSESTREWFLSVIATYELEPHHLRLLTLAAESWDRCAQARQVIDEQGLTYLDRFDALRARPECAIERDNRLAFVRIVRELDLDIEAPKESSSAPQLHSVRR